MAPKVMKMGRDHQPIKAMEKTQNQRFGQSAQQKKDLLKRKFNKIKGAR